MMGHSSNRATAELVCAECKAPVQEIRFDFVTNAQRHYPCGHSMGLVPR